MIIIQQRKQTPQVTAGFFIGKKIKYYVNVDEEDYLKVSKYKWSVKKTGNCIYTRTTINKKKVYLHIFILGKKIGFEIDHINHNGLDNRKNNLRFVTHQENLCNRRINKNNKSGYRGVRWDNKRNNFQAEVRHLGKTYHLGGFKDPIKAAKVRDILATKLFGKYAILNFKKELTAKHP